MLRTGRAAAALWCSADGGGAGRRRGIERREEREGIERMVLAARGVMREMGSRPRVQEGVGLGEAYGPGRPVGLAGLPTPAGPGALSLLHSLEERGRQERKKEKNMERRKRRRGI